MVRSCRRFAAGRTVRASYQRVVDARDAVVVLLGDHERGQVGRVAGREHDREQRPDARHEPTGHTATSTTQTDVVCLTRTE